MLRLKLHDRHRRFWRNACDAADDEAIQHDVADDEDRLAGEAVNEVVRASRIERSRRARHAVSRRSGAAGSVTVLRNGISNSESPKLYSKRPAVKSAATHASAAAGRKRWSLVMKRFHTSRTTAAMNQIQIASAGNPRSAAICSGTLCRWGLIFSTASGPR